jgi:hypothetical protein
VFRCDNGVGVPIDSFAAQWLAYMHPCRRFAPGLTADDARLGADVVRYSSVSVVDVSDSKFKASILEFTLWKNYFRLR